MKKKIDSSSPLYPHWVCAKCGKEAMDKAGLKGCSSLLFTKAGVGYVVKRKV